MRKPAPHDDVVTGHSENTPVRALNRVALVVLVAVLLIGGIAYGLFALFGGKSHGSTLPSAARLAA
jgi:hypothetical protein